MTNKITINGVEIELTDEQAKAVYGAVPTKEENKNPYDVSSYIHTPIPLYYIPFGATPLQNKPTYHKDKWFVGDLIESASIFNNEEYAHQIDLQHTLYRLMDRYSWEHGKADIDWNNDDQPKYYCCFNRITKELGVVSRSGYKYLNVTYFKDKETAKNCIEEVIEPFIAKHPEFKLQEVQNEQNRKRKPAEGGGAIFG